MGNLRWKRRVLVDVRNHPDRGLRAEQMHLPIRKARGQLLERRYIVQNPYSAPVGCSNQVAVMDSQVVERGGRKVESQRLPMIAVIERYVHGRFRTGKQQSPF